MRREKLYIMLFPIQRLSGKRGAPPGAKGSSTGVRMINREEVYKKIARELRNRGAVKIAVFGSYARGEEKPNSDIDILVEFSSRKSLLELVRIERELSETLGIKVDLLTEKSISPYLIDSIKEEMEVIYS
jgi:predicted nucleotidyltransferase